MFLFVKINFHFKNKYRFLFIIKNIYDKPLIINK